MYTLHRDLLPNGLRVITLEVPHLHTALLAVYVRCGSRHETPRTNGVSHFLEHMFFRGSERFPDTVQMNGLVEDVGGSLNGCTMRDQSFYYTPLHPSGVPVGLEVLGDMLCAPRLEKIEVEREIILEEMMDEVDHEGRDIDLGNLSKRLVFGDHPLAYKIAGTPETVRTIGLEDVRAHHGRFYTAANMVLVAAGPVHRDEILEQVSRAFGRLPRGERATEVAAAPRSHSPSFLFVSHDESQTEIQLNFPCAPEEHPDHAALALIRAVLEDGLTSWLPYNIVERLGLAYSIHAGLDVFADASVFEIEAASTPAKVIPVYEEITRLLQKLRTEPLPADELARIKRRQRIGLDFALDDLNALTGWYGATELFREPERFEDRVARLEAVGAEQILDVARRTFRRDNLYLCAVGPAKGKGEAKLKKAAEESLGDRR